MDINQVFIEIKRLNRQIIEEWIKENPPQGKKEGEARYVGSPDFEIIPEDDEVLINFVDNVLKRLLDRIEISERINAGYKIIQLYLQWKNHNNFYSQMKEIATKQYLPNFNKPQREYDKRIKAAKTILKSLPNSDGQNTTKECDTLCLLLKAYIKEQTKGDNQLFGSHRMMHINKFTDKYFGKELKNIMRSYGVGKINIRDITDNLKTYQ